MQPGSFENLPPPSLERPRRRHVELRLERRDRIVRMPGFEPATLCLEVIQNPPAACSDDPSGENCNDNMT
jgi:hypothetical protein